MFVLAANGKFYNGKAGDAWLSADKREAFAYGTREGAQRKADIFNRATCLHGLTFTVEEA